MSSVISALPQSPWRYTRGAPMLRLVLLIAVVLHALLLLIPSRTPDRLPPPRSLEVEIDYLPRSAAAPQPQPVPQPQEAPARQTAAVPVEVPPARVSPPPEAAPPETTRPETPLARIITTALLLEQARHQVIDQAAPVIRIPGVPYLPDLPDNLTPVSYTHLRAHET